jgi:hypothetical protein
MSSRLNSRAERQLAQSLAVLGLQPGASERDVEAAYFTRRASLTALEQEGVAEQLRQLEKALRFIKVTNRFADRKQRPAAPPAPDGDQYGRSLRLLGLKPGASDQEVDAAMQAVRGTVADRARLREFQKAAYFVKTRGRTKKRRRSERHVGRFLIVSSLILVTLTAFSGFQLATRFRHHFVEFEPGDTVFRLEDGKRFGVILEFQENHPFPNGALRDAYSVALYPDGKEAWISAVTAQSALTEDP